MNHEWTNALLGGGLIGIAVSLMLLLNGRVTGISGIIYGLINAVRGDIAWRIYFILGLICGGLVLQFINPASFNGVMSSNYGTIACAGVLVGFGTVLGSGCTSGHGVCGISRLSPRSLAATVLFIFSGVLTVLILRKFGVLP